MKLMSPSALYTSSDPQFSDASYLRNQRRVTRPQTASKVSFASEVTKDQTVRSSKKFMRVKSGGSLKSEKPIPLAFQFPTESTHRPDQLQHRIFQRYQSESFLYAKHETLLSHIKMTDPDVVNHLNLNHFGVQQLGRGRQSILDVDPNLGYSLYDALYQLDKHVMQPLFVPPVIRYSIKTDEIGQPLIENLSPQSRFRIEFLKQTTNILNEPMAQLIRKAGALDPDLSGFIEGIWKYIVVLLDVIAQWSSDRCRNFVDEQVKSTLKSYQDAQEQIAKLHEQLILKVKGNQLRMAVEQKKYHVLHDKYHSLEQDMYLLNRKYEDMGSLDNATGEIYQMGLKLKEMNETIQKVEKSHLERKQELDTQIKGLAEIFVKRHGDLKQPSSVVLEQLGIQPLYDSELHAFGTLHPFTTAIMHNKLFRQFPKDVDSLQVLCDFLESCIANPDKVSLNKSVPQLLIEQIGMKSSNIVVDWILSQKQSSVARIFSIMLGLQGEQCIHPVILSRYCKLLKVIFADKPISALMGPLVLDPTWKDQISDEALISRLLLKVEAAESLETYADMMLLVIEEMQTLDIMKWKDRTARYISNIRKVGFHGNWSAIDPENECNYFIDLVDEKAIWDYMMIACSKKFKEIFTSKTFKPPDEKHLEQLSQQVLDEIRYISLLHPQFFQTVHMTQLPEQAPETTAPQPPASPTRRQSILKRVSTLQPTTKSIKLKDPPPISQFLKKK